MNKNKMHYAFAALLLPCSMLHAMEALDDQSLASATGQNGLNIGIAVNKIAVDQIALIDTDGMSTPVLGQNVSKKAALVMAGNSNAPVNVSFLGNSSGETLHSVIDVDGGNGKPMANIGLGFNNQVTGLKISPFAVYLAGENSIATLGNSKSIFASSNTLNTGVSKFMQVGSDSNNFEIRFQDGHSPQMNVQLGNVPQSQMLQFSGAIQSICGTGTGCPIAFISGNTSAQFDFQATATDASQGFLLNGFYAGVDSTGVVIANTGTSSKLNMALNNMTFGNAGNTATTTFNGLTNGSMGSFGAIGASVKDLKVHISGL